MIGNEPAFPADQPLNHYNPDLPTHGPGMTVRQYFVAQAMAAFVQIFDIQKLAGNSPKELQIDASIVVAYADACLTRELETRKP